MDEEDDEEIATNSQIMTDHGQCVIPSLRDTENVVKYLKNNKSLEMAE